jgi:hypothetical protein
MKSLTARLASSCLPLASGIVPGAIRVDVDADWRFSVGPPVRLQGHNLGDERGLFLSDNLPQNLSNDGGYQVYGPSYLLDFGVKF